uniref:Uncharacterized protein n=1 Tax=Vitis vinifera TaxID=29760 RepID=A5AWB1_VITVI|nr:hypothetical protein VITISV_029052 [Vitis vinifera]
MALTFPLTNLRSICFHRQNPRSSLNVKHILFSYNESSKPSFRISADLAPKARFVARRRESVSVKQLERPLVEYMSLPASQYSVLDAERIERVDDNTFRCYVYRFRFFAFEVCPVLMVKVEEQPNGCCIRLLSCKVLDMLIHLVEKSEIWGPVNLSERQQLKYIIGNLLVEIKMSLHIC